MEQDITLGQYIREARRVRGLTQAWLARNVGVHRSTLYRWETDQSLPTRAHLRSLSLYMRTAMLIKTRAYLIVSESLSHPEQCKVCGIAWVQTCENGRGNLVWHHHDYDKPLDVVGLCHSCHKRLHLGQFPDPTTGRPLTPLVRWEDVLASVLDVDRREP